MTFPSSYQLNSGVWGRAPVDTNNKRSANK
jgi:hypothetical protein